MDVVIAYIINDVNDFKIYRVGIVQPQFHKIQVKALLAQVSYDLLLNSIESSSAIL